MKIRKNKYSRRTTVSVRRADKIFVIVSVVVLVVISAVAGVILGNVLGKKASNIDNETSAEKLDLPIPENEIKPGGAKAVNAYYFDYSTTAASFIKQNKNDFSLCLRSSDGKVMYNSAVAEMINLDSFDGELDLEKNVHFIKSVGGYTCGYIYVSSHAEPDPDMRRIKRAYEISLINEAANMGVDDILILGVVPNASNIDFLCDFLKETKYSLGDKAYLGIALDCAAVLMTDNNVFFAGKLEKCCDYLALDLHDFVYTKSENDSSDTESQTTREIFDKDTGAIYAKDPAQLLLYMRYYILGYSMRVIFADGDTAGIEEAKNCGFADYQTINWIK